MTVLLVMMGAALGATCRWLLDQRIQPSRAGLFPWGTWTVNVLGSLLLGSVLGATRNSADPALVALAGTGFCGGFTTFSTFGYETVRLLERGALGTALANAAASVAVALAAVTCGWLLAVVLWP